MRAEVTRVFQVKEDWFYEITIWDGQPRYERSAGKFISHAYKSSAVAMDAGTNKANSCNTSKTYHSNF